VCGAGRPAWLQLPVLCAEQQALRPQIREQNPKLAKQTRVLKVTVDKASARSPRSPCVARERAAHAA
jgi:hypothetical protein